MALFKNCLKLYSESSVKRTTLGPFQDSKKFPLNRGCPMNRGLFSKGKYHEDANFGTRLSVRLIEGVRLVRAPPNRGFTAIMVW